jgi:REP element-mobilizing transposase RayT
LSHFASTAACPPVDIGGLTDYTLHAWVVMPNHVHMLITPLGSVSALMQRLKGVTAREANSQLGRSGTPFWQHESYDRLVRDAQEFRRIENYIVQNPVRRAVRVTGKLPVVERVARRKRA